jgi:hypothetical protein
VDPRAADPELGAKPMNRLFLGAALICSCVTPAVAEERLAVGTKVRLPTENVYYGCRDVEDTKEVERIRAEGDASGSVGPSLGKGARAVAQFVREHSNACVRLTDINWKVVGIYDWPDGGGPQLICVAPMEMFDVGPQAGTSPPPRCWWTNPLK